MQNDDSKYPSRSLERPGPIEINGSPEYIVEKIIDHKSLGHGNYKFLVRWAGFGPQDDLWIAGRDLEDIEALDIYLVSHVLK